MIPCTGISEVTAVKVVKYVVIGMIIVLTVRVMPYMGALTCCQACVLHMCHRADIASPQTRLTGQPCVTGVGTVQSALGLLTAESPFLQKVRHCCCTCRWMALCCLTCTRRQKEP